MEDAIAKRISELRELTQEELWQLPQTTELTLANERIKLTTYHDILEGGVHRFVVQGIRERWLGIMAMVRASGFEVKDDGNQRLLSPEDLYDFL